MRLVILHNKFTLIRASELAKDYKEWAHSCKVKYYVLAAFNFTDITLSAKAGRRHTGFKFPGPYLIMNRLFTIGHMT